ncbi:DUF2975 domain-containing protein [Dokdonella sp. MW10]|uniref:DUF2975 domain-containing protein n=1 Tax=Dokdonella sp. MW10 TaxID=2992926 RepID=UPI003F7D0DA4
MGIVLAGLLVLLVLERFGWMLAVPREASMPWARVALAACLALPEVLYVIALWWIRRAMREIAAGQLFTPVVTLALQRVGLLMLVGAALGVLVLPSVSAALGAPPGHVIAYDVSKVVIGALGLALGIVGRLLRQAAAIQSELDGIF